VIHYTYGYKDPKHLSISLGDLAKAATNLQDRLITYFDQNFIPHGYTYTAVDPPIIPMDVSPTPPSVWKPSERKQKERDYLLKLLASWNQDGHKLDELLQKESGFLEILAVLLLIQGPVAPRYSSLASLAFSSGCDEQGRKIDRSLIGLASYGNALAILTGGEKQQWGNVEKAVHVLAPKLKNVLSHYFAVVRPAMITLTGRSSTSTQAKSQTTPTNRDWSIYLFSTPKGKWGRKDISKAINKVLPSLIKADHFPAGAMRQWSTRIFSTVLKEFDAEARLSTSSVLANWNPQAIMGFGAQPRKQRHWSNDIHDEKLRLLIRCCYAWHIFLGLRDGSDFPFDGNVALLISNVSHL
jgi:hypothetical protein